MITKLPTVFVSYDSNKIFSYMDNNVCVIPIFSNPILAEQFRKAILAHVDDTRDLILQICNNIEDVSKIIKIISTLSENIVVAINPTVDDNIETINIQDFINYLDSKHV